MKVNYKATQDDFNFLSAVTELDLATATTAPVASVTSLEASLSSWNLFEPSLA